MGLTSLIRKLVGLVLLGFGLIFFFAGLYGFIVSQPAGGVVGLIVSTVFVGLALWILQVSWMRRLASTFSPSPRENSTITQSPPSANLNNLFEQLQNFPRQSFKSGAWIDNGGGVYVIYDKRGALYVGRTNHLYRRLKLEHLQGKGNSAIRRELMRSASLSDDQVAHYLKNECDFQYVKLDDERLQTDLEHYVKLRLHPHVNF